MFNSNQPGNFRNSAAWLKPLIPPEMAELLSLVEDPAILLDRNRNVVAASNPSFSVLTAFDQREISGAPITVLIDGIEINEAFEQEGRVYWLHRRKREAVAVRLRIRFLEGSHNLSLVIFLPAEEGGAALEDMETRFQQSMVFLSSLPQPDEPDLSFQKAAEAVLAALKVDQVVIYQANPEGPNFHKVAFAGEDLLLPESFQPADMAKLGEPQLWQPGRRMQVDIHRAARVQNLNFVCSAPMGQPGIWVGVLVVAGRQSPPSRVEDHLVLFAAQLTRIIDQHLLVSELKRQIQDNLDEINISRIVNESMSEGVIVIAPDLTILSINTAVEWILGYAEWEVTGYPLDTILIGPDILQSTITSAERGLLLNPINNVTLHKRNGESFPARITVVPGDASESPAFLVVFIQDVSENEEIRQRTQQLEQRAVLGEVTAVFAHEVRNPINNIYSGLQLMAANFEAGTSQREDINRLLTDCNRLNHLMESVLNFSRSNKYVFEKVDIQVLIRRILDRWRPRLNNLNINAFFTAEDETPAVSGDPRALDQVFQNLVRNSVDAMEAKGGTLAIRVEPVRNMPARPQVMITVSDDGPGIPDEIRERIFEPFVSTKTQGTGLGLAIIKRIITAHHGWIRVNSFPGATMFEITLNAYKEES